MTQTLGHTHSGSIHTEYYQLLSGQQKQSSSGAAWEARAEGTEATQDDSGLMVQQTALQHNLTECAVHLS